MMSDLSLEVYLAAKTETQLRNYLFKMEGGVARLNGNKDTLVRRAVQAFQGLSGERQLEVMPGFPRARQNWRRTSNLAAQVSRNPPPQVAPPPALPNPPTAAPLHAPAQQGGARPRLQAMA